MSCHSRSRRNTSNACGGLATSLPNLYRHINEAMVYFHDTSLDNVTRANGIAEALGSLNKYQDTRANFRKFTLIGGTDDADPQALVVYHTGTYMGEFQPELGTNLAYTISFAHHWDKGQVVANNPHRQWSRNVGERRQFDESQQADGEGLINNAIAMRISKETNAITSGAALTLANRPIALPGQYGSMGGFRSGVGLATGGAINVVNC